MRRLSSLDAQFLAAEHGNSGSHYCGLAIYQTGNRKPITAATMRQRLIERTDVCAPLRWKLVTVPFSLDRPVFVDTDVNLEDHVSETTLAAPADETTLGAEVAKTRSTPLDRDKPLWKLQVFHGLRGRTAGVMTLHHAAVDGIAAGEIFSTLLDSPDGKPSAAPTGNRPAVSPNRAALAARGIASMPLRRLRSVRSTPGALAHLDQVPVLRSLPGVHTISQIARGDLGAQRLDAPRTRFNAKLSAGRSVAFGTLPLSDVKTIKNALSITVNDVVIALCAGALRRRLTATSDLPAEPLVAYIPCLRGCQTRKTATETRLLRSSPQFLPTHPTHMTDSRSHTRSSIVLSSVRTRRRQRS